MALHALANPNYEGSAGLQQLRALQIAMVDALQRQDWLEVRRLDKVCPALIDKVISANRADASALVVALNELKSVYADIIGGCQKKVASMAV